MSKLVLNEVNLELGAEAATAALSANWAAIESFADTVLSRSNVPPNQMQTDLDMNGYGILNMIQPTGDGVIRYVDDAVPLHRQSLVKDLKFVGAVVSAGTSKQAVVTIAPAASQVSYVPGSTGLPSNAQDAITALDTATDAAGTLASTANSTANTALANAAAAQSTANTALTANPVAPAVTDSSTARTATAAQAGDYTRFTNASAKTYTFDAGSNTYVANKEYHVRNVGAGNLTVVGAGGMTINPPAGGSLVLPQNTTATIKILSGTTADMIGGGSAGGGGGVSLTENKTPDSHPPSPTIYDDEFEAVSLDAKWTWYNQGTSSATVANGNVIIIGQAGSSASPRVLGQTIPAGSWKFRCKMTGSDFPQVNFTRAGMAITRVSANKTAIVGNSYSSGSKLEANTWSNTSFNAAIGSPIATPGTSWDTYYFEIQYDGSAIYTFRYSRTGVEGTFVTLGTENQATYLGGAADKIGFVVNSENSSPITVCFDWFRRIS